MMKYKKIISAVVVGSLLIGNIQFSLASSDEKPTAEEIKKVESQIVSLQSNMFDSSKNMFEKFSGEFKKLAHYEEKGNLSIDMNIDEAAFGKGKASFTLDNYSAKASLFNSEVSGDVKLSANYAPVYGSGFEIDLSTFASMISKDSEVYVLLKDFDFKVNSENISEILTQVKEQFQDNTYLKLPTDEQAKVGLELLKSFQAQSFFSQVDTTLQSAFLTPYKKVGNKYLLVPTKYACDNFFLLNNKLNTAKSWYTPMSCTQAIYKKVVSDFIKNGDLYIVLGDTQNTLGYYGVDAYDKSILDLQIQYDDNSITKVDLSLTPDQAKYKNEGWTLHYAKNEFFKTNLSAKQGAYKINFYSELDEMNHFSEIDASINLDKELVGTLILKNNKLNGFLMGKQKGYDYNSDNWEYKLKNIFATKVTGNFSEKNELQSMVVKFAGVNVENKKAFLLGKLGYNSGVFTTYMKYEDTLGKLILNGKGQVENKYFFYDANMDVNNLYRANMSYKIDARDNKNNANISFVVNNGIQDVVSLKIVSKATREYKNDIQIEAPKDFSTYFPKLDDDRDEYGDDEYDDYYNEYSDDYLDGFEEIE